ncbi:unnamed protein product [Adineta steineri]|uniref:LysM domain-containing protein n=1 Tax=Adineta steineri TaxID=433720 RepID=A0A818QQM6_9BILA|nr:unnamed protein product [Adineta steineri]CAF3644445.1 unnamed protein product [Adineta steineri]
MDKISTEIPTNGPTGSIMTPTEKRALSEVMHNTKRSGGNYGSLAKSQIQPTFYICHKLEINDTMQRLALKYNVNIQEIKRINKLWSDAELSLLKNVYIPVNLSLLSTLRTLYPDLNVVQNLSPTAIRVGKTSTNGNDEGTSDNPVSIQSTTTNNTSFQDYFSKIDQQIQTSKKSLETFDVKKQHLLPQSNDTSYSSNDDNNNDLNSSQNTRTTIWNNGRHKDIHHLSDNNITAQNQREKHISAALQRIQQEKDDFDEL